MQAHLSLHNNPSLMHGDALSSCATHNLTWSMCTNYNSWNWYNPVDEVILFLVNDMTCRIHFGFIDTYSLQNHAETLCVLEEEQSTGSICTPPILMHLPTLHLKTTWDTQQQAHYSEQITCTKPLVMSKHSTNRRTKIHWLLIAQYLYITQCNNLCHIQVQDQW